MLSGIRHSRTPHPGTEILTKGPQESQTRDVRSTLESLVVHEGKCSHGSMEELSSQALAQSERQPFRKSSSHGMCLEKSIERGMVGCVAGNQESYFDNYGPVRDSHSTSNCRRGEALRVEPRMIHTPSLSLQCRTESGAEAHEVETLHLDNM